MIRLSTLQTKISIGLFLAFYLSIMLSAGGKSWLALAPGVFAMFILPGWLVLKNLRIKTRSAPESLAYSAGISTMILIVTGLLLSAGFTAFGLEQALAAPNLLGVLTAVILGLAYLASARKVPLSISFNFRRPTAGEIFAFGAPPVLVAAAAMGAISLNNGGSNVFAMAATLGIGMYFTAILLLHKRVPDSVYPYSLFFISLSLLLAVSLRGWILSGHDILTEYYAFQLTNSHLNWSISYFRDAYNACLSITILPTMISQLLPISDMYIFRTLYQALFSLTPVALFVLMNRFLEKRYAYIAVIFFMSQEPFLRDFPYLSRQEIAIFFFTLSLVALFSRTLSNRQRYTLFGLFSVGMVLSHYSTTYIAVGLFGGAFFIDKVFLGRASVKNWFDKLKNSKKLNWAIGKHLPTASSMAMSPTAWTYSKRGVLPSGWLFLVLVLATITWNTLITHTSNNISMFANTSIKALTSPGSVKSSGQGGVLQQFNIFRATSDNSALTKTYANQKPDLSTNTTDDQSEHYSAYTYAAYTPVIDLNVLLKGKLDSKIVSAVFFTGELFKKLIKVFILVGSVWIIYRTWRSKAINRDMNLMFASGLGVLAAGLVLPVLSVQYDIMRTYQQLLIVLALPAVVGSLVIFKRFRPNMRYYLTVASFGFYYLFISPFIPQAVGSGDANIQLNNFGLYYNLYLTHQGEYSSIRWLSANGNPDIPIYSDWYSKKKITAFSGREVWTIDNVLPQNLTKNSYVYESTTNLTTGTAYVYYNGNELSYRYPATLLNDEKDTIYSNGSSSILK